MKAIRDNHIPGETRPSPVPSAGRTATKSVAQNLSAALNAATDFPIGADHRLSTIRTPAPGAVEKLPTPSLPRLSGKGAGRPSQRRASRRPPSLPPTIWRPQRAGGGATAASSPCSSAGEKITLAIEYRPRTACPALLCRQRRRPQGILSLTTDGQDQRGAGPLLGKGPCSISVLTHPHPGGVTAGFALPGDIICAARCPRLCRSPGHPRLRQPLPEGFQRAEEHGFVDAVVPRLQMRDTLAQLLRLHEKGGRT